MSRKRHPSTWFSRRFAWPRLALLGWTWWWPVAAECDENCTGRGTAKSEWLRSRDVGDVSVSSSFFFSFCLHQWSGGRRITNVGLLYSMCVLTVLCSFPYSTKVSSIFLLLGLPQNFYRESGIGQSCLDDVWWYMMICDELQFLISVSVHTTLIWSSNIQDFVVLCSHVFLFYP